MDGGESASSIESVEVTEVSESPEVDVESSEGYNVPESYEDCEASSETGNNETVETSEDAESYDDCELEKSESIASVEPNDTDDEYNFEDCEISDGFEGNDSAGEDTETEVADSGESFTEAQESFDEKSTETRDSDDESGAEARLDTKTDSVDNSRNVSGDDVEIADSLSKGNNFNEKLSDDPRYASDEAPEKYDDFGDDPRLRDDIKDNPEFIDENGDIKWPENDGFAGDPESVTLEHGTVIDRYGSEEGRFTANAGTPYEERGLPFDESSQEYHSYEVIKPIEDVKQGKVADAFNQPGGGTQQKLPESVNSLIESGKLRRI